MPATTFVVSRFEVDIAVADADSAFVTDVSCFNSETNAWCHITLQANVPSTIIEVPVEPLPSPEPGLSVGLGAAVVLLGVLGRIRGR